MPGKSRRKTSRIRSAKKSLTSLNQSLEYTVKLTKQAYEEREQTCTYTDYLALITLATFNQHEIRHLQINKYKSNAQIELELLKRWNKLPLEIAYIRMDNDQLVKNKSSTSHRLSVRKELEMQWNDLPEEERIVHKRVVTNRDIEARRFF